MEPIQRYASTDLDQALGFRRRMYGPESIMVNPQYMKWMFETSGAAQSPYWLFRKAGQVEAHCGGIPLQLWVSGEKHHALWLVDLRVSQACRRQGVGVKMAKAVLEEHGIALALEVTESSHRMFLKEGWVDTGTVPLYMRPMDPTVLVEGRVGAHVLDRVRGPARQLFGLFDFAVGLAHQLTGLSMVPVRRFDERVDTVWETFARQYAVIGQRDCRTLNWRFADYPEPDRYRLMTFVRDGETKGYAVLRLGKRHGRPAGYLVDYFVDPLWSATAINLCIGWFREQDVAAVYCLQSNAAAAVPLMLNGFLRRDSGWNLMYRAPQLSSADQARMAHQRGWYITAMDSNVDRRREGTVIVEE